MAPAPASDCEFWFGVAVLIALVELWTIAFKLQLIVNALKEIASHP